MSFTKQTRFNSQDRNQRYIYNYKISHSCIRCKESNPMKLTFHHIDSNNKSYDISNMIHKCYSLDTIQKEIDKCEVICYNCHMELESIKRNDYNYKLLNEYSGLINVPNSFILMPVLGNVSLLR